ncbi:MAG: hypothetical protein MH219_04195 [Marinobacter sp.]|nr:hypothetical protein [Marinobacter sp.]
MRHASELTLIQARGVFETRVQQFSDWSVVADPNSINAWSTDVRGCVSEVIVTTFDPIFARSQVHYCCQIADLREMFEVVAFALVLLPLAIHHDGFLIFGKAIHDIQIHSHTTKTFFSGFLGMT